MTDFEMDKTYKITGRELLALLSLIPDGTEKAKVIMENVAGREKSTKVNERPDYNQLTPAEAESYFLRKPLDDIRAPLDDRYLYKRW